MASGCPRGSCALESRHPGGSGSANSLPNRYGRSQRRQGVPILSQKSFADLGLSQPVVGALADRGMPSPFAIQSLVIEDVLDGVDVLAKSPTGSGKTIAFAAPIIDVLERDARRPAALVLAPTRELVSQIVEEARPLAAARGLKVAAVYGGVGFEKQTKRRPRRAPAGRHARPPRGPAAAPLALAGRRRDPRPRRGRPHARHGLPPRRRPHRPPVPGRPPDAVLLGHARR